MRSLFLKIFLCFWLTHTLAVALVFVITNAIQTARIEAIRNETPRIAYPSIPPSAALAEYARNATTIYEQAGASSGNGQNALLAYLDKLESQAGFNLAFLNENGEELSGHDVSKRGQKLSVQAAISGETEVAFERGGLITARRARSASGAVYILVAEVPRFGGRIVTVRNGAVRSDGTRRGGTGARIDRRETQTATLLLALLMAAGIVSFGLARYLTAPTVKLRQATYQLASGDLSTRVGPKMGRRRDELADLGRDFDLMAERIESSMQRERRLLGDISHELRSPLARLQVALDLASQTADGETRGFLDRIERESGRMNEMIGYLLTLTRLENEGAEARRQPVDLSQLVNEVVADADFEARGRNRSVIVVGTSDCTVAGNATLLRSAIENVVRNGVRYTEEATAVEVTLQCSTAENKGNSEREKPPQAIIRVRDHGPGVPPDTLPHLFRAFYRVADARDRQSGGVGLGLSITARAVHLHGGEVEAFNAEGGGLLVELRIPIGTVSETAT